LSEVATSVVKLYSAIDENFKLIMIRPDHVVLAKENDPKGKFCVQVGTVIDFPEGKSDLMMLLEAKIAIQNGVDEIDFSLQSR
jgi:deoxyribose-phosphate aldolase